MDRETLKGDELVNRIAFCLTVAISGVMTGGALLGFRAPDLRDDASRMLGSVVGQQAPQISLPPGFAVQQVYSGELSEVVTMAFDEQGRLALGQRDGPVLMLTDTNADGTFDRSVVVRPDITNAQGLAFDGPDLLVVATGPDGSGSGLYRAVDSNGDGTSERLELIEQAWGVMEAHASHGIFWGPDGFLYWAQGNASGLHSPLHPLSPLRFYDNATLNARCDPRGHACMWRAPGGTFVRSSIQLRGSGEPLAGSGASEWELYAGGLRNQYDGVFNILGELFTYDSDMEWDVNMPWYKGTSSVHVVAGGDHAWRSGSGNHPWHYIDNLPPMADMGRGSPTGVTVLQTYNYPAEYWDMVLQSDWSRGRVIGGRLEKNGATYTQSSINFIQGQPLNVTDMEVGPDGNLYFTLGPDPTGVYRVTYNGPNAMTRPVVRTPLEGVLTMIQPRSSYSRAQARRTKAEMGERAWRAQLTAVVSDARATPERRVRALELLQVYGPQPDEPLLSSLVASPAWEVRSAAAYHLGMKKTDSSRRLLVTLAKDGDPFVQRRALEGLLRSGIHSTQEPVFSPAADILPLLASPDRFVRYQARHVLNETRRALWQNEAMALSGYPQAPEALMALVETMRNHNPRLPDVTRVLTRTVELLRQNPSEAEMLPVVRVIQRAMMHDYGVVDHQWLGNYLAHNIGFANPRLAEDLENENTKPTAYVVLGDLLLDRFPARDTLLSREIARTLVALKNPGIVPLLTAELEKPSNSRVQQIFYADQLGFMREGWDDQSIERLASWLDRAWTEGWRGGASFAGYLNYIREDLVESVPAERRLAMDQRLRGAFERAQPQIATALFAGERPNSPLDDEEVFEGLVYSSNVLAANPAGGVAAFEKAGCISCHTFGPIGIAFGPDLTTIHQRFDRRALVRKVLFPHERVNDLYKGTEIVRNDGTRLVGLPRDVGSNVVVSIAGSVDVTIPAADIRSRAPSERSIMPQGLLNNLDSQQRRDLFALLLAGPAAIPDTARARLGGGN